MVEFSYLDNPNQDEEVKVLIEVNSGNFSGTVFTFWEISVDENTKRIEYVTLFRSIFYKGESICPPTPKEIMNEFHSECSGAILETMMNKAYEALQ